MKKLNIDSFKVLIIILLIWIGYSMHNISLNGRFAPGGSGGLLDTRTGKKYSIYENIHSKKYNRWKEIVSEIE